MKHLSKYVFLVDNTQPEISVENNIKFNGQADFVKNIFKYYPKYSGMEVAKNRVVKLTNWNGVDKFIVNYNCYWHQDWYTSIHKINPKILDAIRSGIGKIVFGNQLEGQPLESKDDNHNFLEPMYKELERLKIPPQNVIYITANCVADRFHDKYCEKNNIKDRMNIIGIMTEALEVKADLAVRSLSDYTFEEHFEILKQNKNNVRHWIKAHRNDRHYKTIPMHHLWSVGLQDTMYTHIRKYARGDIGYPDTERHPADYQTKKWLQKLLFSRPSFEKTLPYKIDFTCDWQMDNFNSDRDFSKGIYQMALFNMYPSSWPFWEDTAFLRHGVSWHFWEYQPLLIYGNLNSLQYLRERGYETFPELFDESYDTEQNRSKRLRMVCEEMERISRIPIDKCFDMYYSVKDKLIHNRKVLESDMELKRFMEWFDEAIR